MMAHKTAFTWEFFCSGLVKLREGDAQANFDDFFILYVDKIDTFSSIVLVLTTK